MRRIVLTFGLIAGGLLSLMMLVSMAFADRIGFDRAEVLGYTTMVLAFLMVFFGIRSYRENVGGGVIRFGRAFAVGILIVLVTSVCYVATWEFIYYRMMPDFGERYAAHQLAEARASGATEAQIAERTRKMEQFREMYRNPFVNIGITFLEVFPVGLVMTLVSAGILSRGQGAPRASLTAGRGQSTA